MSAEPVPAPVDEVRVALGAHLDTLARVRNALGHGPETNLILTLLDAAGSVTGWGRRDTDDLCGHLRAAYLDVLRGPT